ncbi:RlmE family RNA methyltransferase [Candidatus Peregrinibacteria bacterium]|jgi:23S rRNA (uridine2552-2'-O)-methyltransferase|nr:RlmE family RNA methyltransferase [Candidatus Peregrinibacteria bacterium]
MPQKYKVQDKFFKAAKREGYRARSAYKLLEIGEMFPLFRKVQSVLDLGCSPGSWLQVLREKTSGTVIGLDLKETEELEDVSTFICDVFSEDFEKVLRKTQGNKKIQFDLITSDMAPKTMGIFDVDQYASVELNLQALDLVKKYLKPGGWAVFKIFRGEDFNDFWFEAKKAFPKMKTFKPQACRDRSFELYCIGKKSVLTSK